MEHIDSEVPCAPPTADASENAKPEAARSPKASVPEVGILIPAYNEQDVIGTKLSDIYRTSLSLERFEVLVGSDGSIDETAERVREFARVHGIRNLRLFEYQNEGKSSTLNKLIEQSRAEILLGTDADSTFDDSEVLGHLLGRFASDRGMGGVSCVPLFETNAVEAAYWRSEQRIRDFLSRRRSLFVVTGMGFAFRKSCVEPIPHGIMADDLWLPLTILRNGFSVVADHRFRARTRIFRNSREITRKIRVIKGGIQCFGAFFRRYPRMILSEAFLWMVVFKVSRWMIPAYLAAGALALTLWDRRLAGAAAAAIGVASLFSPHLRYLLYGAVSPALALGELLRGKNIARWSHSRD